jgi:hypothetical protein
MELIRSSKTSAQIRTTWRCIPEDNIHNYRCEKLKSCTESQDGQYSQQDICIHVRHFVYCWHFLAEQVLASHDEHSSTVSGGRRVHNDINA